VFDVVRELVAKMLDEALYRPAKDQSGKVVGCLAIAIDFSASYAALKEQIKKISIGETGYVFVIDGQAGADRGKAVIHPKLEGKNVLDTVSADGLPIIREMIEKKNGLLRYAWLNKGESAPRDKLTVYRFFEPWQWLVGAGSYREEFQRLAHTVTLWMIGGALAVVLALIGVLFLLVRHLVGKPLHSLQAALAELAAGGGDH
jgi:signal transduction histidine kinase